MADKVNSIEDLERLQAMAATQGVAITNYHEWNQIMQQLEEMGVESTGSYAGDKAKIEQVKISVEEYIQEAQVEKATQESKKEDQKVKELAQTDSEQTVKANVANATSSQLMADYMKIFHLLP